MPFRSTPNSPRYSGIFRDMVNDTLELYHNGVLVQTLATAGTTFPTNVTLLSTLTAGADGVGADGEQLTSGGAGAEMDWSASGV